jgi:hypothetical protein
MIHTCPPPPAVKMEMLIKVPGISAEILHL